MSPVAAQALARPELRVEPQLAEAAVRRALAASGPEGAAALAAFQARCEPAYRLSDDRSRDAAFARVGLETFAELDLGGPILAAVAERPALRDRVRLVLVGEAGGRTEEGVTWEPGGTHIGFRVALGRLDDTPGLLAWARHALGHAEDTADATFGFRPGWEGAAGVPAAAQARLHRLWDVAVDARLASAGRLAPGAALRRHRDRLAADLPGVDAATLDAVVRRLWQGPRPSFGALLAWALRPRDLIADVAPAAAVLERRDVCPLCRFPGDDVVAPEPAIAALVALDYPAWRPEHGLCGRCTDRYRFLGHLGGAV